MGSGKSKLLPARSAIKVLIVDDSKIVCERLEQMLIHIAGVEIVGQARNARMPSDSFLNQSLMW